MFDSANGHLYPISWLRAAQMDSADPAFRLPAEVASEILLRNFKPYLKLGLPYYCSESDNWQPVLQWSDRQQVPLSEVMKALQTLLSTLNPKAEQAENASSLLNLNSYCAIAADNLERETLFVALSNLAGVIVSCFADWPEAYRFNLRESILAAGLVTNADQICFVEEAIAAFLAELHLTANSQAPTNLKSSWQGPTLILHAGATTTQLALVDLPTNIQNLTYSDFTLRSFPYAGTHLDRDIICQLLLNADPGFSLRSDDSSIGLDFDLPLPGEPDLSNHYLLQQKLESSSWGQNLLRSAEYVKLGLPHQDSFTLDLGKYCWVLQHQDLENRVFTPFINRLNRELNTLLTRLGIPVEAIGQAICTGGTALLPSVGDWLRQKLPNAKIIQPSESQIGRVALGLAVLPAYPQLCDRSGQQYSEYFLLMELLRVFGEEPLTLGKIQHLLEVKGINTRVCFSSLLAILDGYLPLGLVPSDVDANLLSQESWQNPDYQALRGNKLFEKENNQTYRLNTEYSHHLRQYLTKVLAQTEQKLEDPYALYWLIPKVE